MNCNQARIKLDCYVDGELSGNEMIALQSHFARCPDCCQELQTIRILKAELASLNHNRPNPGDDFEDRLMGWVARQAEQRPAVRRRRLQAAFATVIAIAAISTMSVRTSVSQQRLAEQNSIHQFELAKDQAYVSGDDPLAGSTFLMPASYNK